MKTCYFRLLLAGVLAAYCGLVYAQDADQSQKKGFYLGMEMGPAWGKCNGVDNMSNTISVTGTGINFGIRIGGFVSPDLALHGTFTMNSIFGPKFNDVKVGDNISFDEVLYGAGVTKYFSPVGIFISGSAGLGKFIINDDSENGEQAVSTESGFGFQINAGKEWTISRRWSLGATAFYSGTYLKSDPEPSVEEKWDSSRYGIVFHATFN